MKNLRKKHKKGEKVTIFRKIWQILCPLIFLGHDFTAFGVDGTIRLGGKHATSQSSVNRRSWKQCARCKYKAHQSNVVKIFKVKKV